MSRLVTVLFAALACALAPAAAHADHSALAGRWHLDEGATGPSDHVGATPDSSGHGLTGIVRYMDPVPGRFATAFAGLNSISAVRVPPTSLLQPPTVTLIAWVRRSGDPGTVKAIAAQGADGTCGHASYALYTGGSAPGAGGLQFYIWNGAQVHLSPNAGTSMWDGAWHMLAGTYDGAAVRLYVDGQQVGSGTPATGPIAYGLADNTFTIGNYANPAECGGITNFTGDVDETRVYNRALSPTEISRLAAHPGADPPELVPDGPPGSQLPPGPGPGPSPPPPRPVASFTAPSRVAQLQPVVLDARASTGAARLLWDIDGDGRDDAECGANAPVLSLRTATAQTLDVRLTAVAADGRTSIARHAVSVAGAPLAGARKVPEVAACSSSPQFLFPKAAATNLCVKDSKVLFGIVEAQGCFENVKSRDALPTAEARVVDEYYANAKLPAFAEALCRQGSPRCPELLTKYTALDLLVSRSRVRINGLTFDPQRGGSIVVFPGLERVVSSNAKVTLRNPTLGTIPVLDGSIDLDLKSRYKSLGKLGSATGRAPLFSFDARRDLPSIGGFAIAGQIDLAFARHDERRYTEATVRLTLPPVFDAFGGRPPSGEVTMTADNANGLILDRLHLAVPEANLGGLRFTNVSFAYSHAGDAANNCARKWWKATANVFLGTTGKDAGFVLSPPPSQNGVAFCNGGFRSAGGSLLFGAQIPPPQLFPGVQLNRIDFAVALNPTLVRGGGRISVAGVSDITGTFLAAFASPGAPYVLSAEDAGPELGGLAGRRLVSTSMALGGTAGIQVPALGRLPLGNAYLLYSYPDYVAFGGGARVVAPGMSIEGKVDGELAVGRRLFSTHGDVRACIAAFFPCVGLGAWVTSKGMVACATGDGLHPGAGYRWGDTWPTIWLFDGCKPSRYWVTVRAAESQTGPRSFTLARGERGKNVRLQGTAGAPSVQVRAPDGETVSTAGRDDAAGPTLRVLRQEEGKVTWIGVVDGKPGTYTITPLPGSVPIAGLAASRPGHGAITASVRGSGRRRTLRYDVGPHDGQRVTFFERGDATFRPLGTATARRGAIRFAPAPGPAGTRQIVAQVLIDGVPTPDRVLARYRAPSARKPGRPSRLRVRRTRTALVASWRGVAGARGYGIAIRQRNGRERLLRLGPGRRRARFTAVPLSQSGSVTLRALGPLGDWGRPAGRSFRATRRPFTRLRAFEQLGRQRRR